MDTRAPSANLEAVQTTLYVAAIKMLPSVDASRRLLRLHEEQVAREGAGVVAQAVPSTSGPSTVNAMVFAYCRAGRMDDALALVVERVRGSCCCWCCCRCPCLFCIQWTTST